MMQLYVRAIAGGKCIMEQKSSAISSYGLVYHDLARIAKNGSR